MPSAAGRVEPEHSPAKKLAAPFSNPVQGAVARLGQTCRRASIGPTSECTERREFAPDRHEGCGAETPVDPGRAMDKADAGVGAARPPWESGPTEGKLRRPRMAAA